jgi:hypothetical protein
MSLLIIFLSFVCAATTSKVFFLHFDSRLKWENIVPLLLLSKLFCFHPKDQRRIDKKKKKKESQLYIES